MISVSNWVYWIVKLSLLTTSLTGIAGAVTFTETTRFNLDSTADALNPEFIGSNAATLAWTGSRLFVGGFNNSGSFADIGLLEVDNATATGMIDAPTFARLTTLAFTPAGRGITSMDVSADGLSLAVAYDDGLAGTPGGYSVYDTGTNTLRWSVDERGTSGSTFDPGFQGAGTGTGFGAFGSGRVQLYDTTTGGNLADLTNGDIWFNGTGGTLVRDIDFDPATGDIYVRHNNNLSRAIRTGVDGTIPQGVITSDTQADFVGFQNLSFMTYLDGDTEVSSVIYNNRPTNSPAQAFEDVIRVISPDGTPETSQFAFLDGGTLAISGGAYDFDFDFTTRTLAMVDFQNRNVHIFTVSGGGGGASCDVDGNGDCDTTDLRVVYDNIALASSGGSADIDGSGTVDNADIGAWLAVAGATNGQTYLPGDVDLSGGVAGGDFTALAANFGSTGLPGAYWDQGNFDGNTGGVFSVGGGDFTSLAANFGSGSLAAVPEGSTALWMAPLVLAGLLRRRQ